MTSLSTGSLVGSPSARRECIMYSQAYVINQGTYTYLPSRRQSGASSPDSLWVGVSGVALLRSLLSGCLSAWAQCATFRQEDRQFLPWHVPTLRGGLGRLVTATCYRLLGCFLSMVPGGCVHSAMSSPLVGPQNLVLFLRTGFKA